MSAIAKFESVKEIVIHSRVDFVKIAKITGINFEREQAFAIQALRENDYLSQVAYNNKDSLRMAILNVAAAGLSLNPVRKQAYLVPRDGKVYLDVSYQGLIQLAVDAGAIVWAKAEIVYEKDEFKYHGFNRAPTHEFNPFLDRGKILGAYCVAKTHADEYLTTTMPIDEVFGIRDRSKAWISFKNGKAKTCPWATDEGEMIKKTVIRRAYKSWPITDTRRERFEKAIEITNEDHEIIDTAVVETQNENYSQEILKTIREQLDYLDRTEDASVEFLSRTCGRKIEALEDLTPSELEGFRTMLNGFVDKQLEQEGEDNEDN